MKRSALAMVSALVVAAGTVVAATPASALKASTGSTTCTVEPYTYSDGAGAKAVTCSSVRSRTKYRDSGGTLRTVTSGWGTKSSARGTTLMVVYRGVQASRSGGTSLWYSY